MMESAGKAPDDLKSETLPEPDSSFVGADYEIVLHRTESARARVIERRRFEFVMLATILAGFWALMSGSFVVMLLTACRDLIG